MRHNFGLYHKPSITSEYVLQTKHNLELCYKASKVLGIIINEDNLGYNK